MGSRPHEAKGAVLLLPPTSRDAEALGRLFAAEGIAHAMFADVDSLSSAINEEAGLIVLSEEAVVSAEAHALFNRVRAQPVWSDLPVIVLARAGVERPSLTTALGLLANVSVLERPSRVTTLLSMVRSGLRARKRQYEVREHLRRLAEINEAVRESEHHFRQIADTMAHMIWVTSPDGYHEWYNRRWYEFTGVPEGSTDGVGWNGMFHHEDQSRAWERWRECLRTGDLYEIEYRLRHHSGEYRWVLGRALPLRDAHGRIERWFGSCTDIHAMRQLTDERERLLESERSARAEAERAGHMKDEFLATLSHELRTPLNAILGWAQILRASDTDPEDVGEGLEIIERNARAQTQIIEDLLDMSRIISGKIRLDVHRLSLAPVVQAAIETIRPAADAKGVHIRVVFDSLAGPVSGDPNRLQQVFWNLLSNAVKFTPKGGQVQVVLERVESHLEVHVTDTGEGILPTFLPHVFDRFRQADGATTRRHGGLGIGLAIVKQLIELHGGSVRASSEGQGRGATFTVSLPLTALQTTVDNEDSPGPRHTEAGPNPVLESNRQRMSGLKVLVVDDEPDSRALVKRLLEDCEAVVVTAGSAREAFERLRDVRPDVIVTDIGMPGEDGYTLIRRVRSLPREHGGATPAIALTAYARAEDRIRSVMAGFQHHVVKPVEPAELITMVASLAQ